MNGAYMALVLALMVLAPLFQGYYVHAQENEVVTEVKAEQQPVTSKEESFGEGSVETVPETVEAVEYGEAIANCPAPVIYKVPHPSGGDDGPAIREVVEAAIADLQAGVVDAAEVRFRSDAEYTLESRSDRYDVIDIRTNDLANPKVKCLTLNGRGATLNVDQLSSVLYVGGCENCSIKRFKFFPKQISSTQGVIVGKNSTDQYIDVVITDGFPLPKLPVGYEEGMLPGHRTDAITFYAYTKGAIDKHLTTDVKPLSFLRVKKAEVLNKKNRKVRLWLKEGDVSSNARVTKVIENIQLSETIFSSPFVYDGGTRRQAMTALWKDSLSKQLKKNPEYSKAFFLGDTAGAIVVEFSSNVEFKHIRLSDFPAQGIRLKGNEGRITLDRVKMIPREFGHLTSTAAAGVRANYNRVGPEVTNSVFENIGDDAINFSIVPYTLTEIVDEKTAILSGNQTGPIFVGDTFALYNSKTGKKKATRKVEEVTILSSSRYEVTFSKKLPSGINDINSANPDAFLNLSKSNIDGVIDDNLFLGTIRNGIIMRSGGRITNNRFVNLTGYAIGYGTIITNDSARGVWGNTEPLIVHGNRIIDAEGLLAMGAGIPSGFAFKYDGISVKNNKAFNITEEFLKQRASQLTVPIQAASGNTVTLYDTDTRTAAQLVSFPGWTTGALQLKKLPAADLNARKLTESGVNLQSAKKIREFHGISGGGGDGGPIDPR